MEEEKKGGSKGGRLSEEDRLRMEKGEKRIKMENIVRETSEENKREKEEVERDKMTAESAYGHV
jgi:hypothetical protein